VGAPLPPHFESPHAVIEPPALRAAKAYLVKTDGSITAWGDSNSGGASAPTDSGYTKVYSNRYAFSALKADGSITAWAGWGGLGPLSMGAPMPPYIE
jgi:hypothetical protein